MTVVVVTAMAVAVAAVVEEEEEEEEEEGGAGEMDGVVERSLRRASVEMDGVEKEPKFIIRRRTSVVLLGVGASRLAPAVLSPRRASTAPVLGRLVSGGLSDGE